jgi:NADH-quinone oxidoreductase subunit B
MLLQQAIGRERRPLSWVVGDQGVIKAEKISQRDLLTDERMRVTQLRDPDHV